jgi:hypothetical protein
MNKKMMTGLVLLVVLLAVAVLLLVDSHITSAQAQFNSQSMATSVSAGSFFPANGVQGIPEVSLYVVGNDRISDRLRKDLLARIQTGTGGLVNNVRLEEGQPPLISDKPVMVVEVESQSIFWTPFYANSQISAKMVLATDGNTQEGAMAMTDGTAGILRARVTSTGSLTAYGLMTLPAHYHQLADAVAEAMVTQLTTALQSQRPTP